MVIHKRYEMSKGSYILKTDKGFTFGYYENDKLIDVGDRFFKYWLQAVRYYFN